MEPVSFKRILITVLLVSGTAVTVIATFLLLRCDKTDTGIVCTLNNGELRYGIVERTFERQLVHFCAAKDGRYTCPGRCLPGDVRFCDYHAAEDAGTACTDSMQCTSICWAIDDCSEGGCLGMCGAYPLRLCDQYTEVVRGVPQQHIPAADCVIQ